MCDQRSDEDRSPDDSFGPGDGDCWMSSNACLLTSSVIKAWFSGEYMAAPNGDLLRAVM